MRSADARLEGRAEGLNEAIRIVRRAPDLEGAVRAVAEALLRSRAGSAPSSRARHRNGRHPRDPRPRAG